MPTKLKGDDARDKREAMRERLVEMAKPGEDAASISLTEAEGLKPGAVTYYGGPAAPPLNEVAVKAAGAPTVATDPIAELKHFGGDKQAYADYLDHITKVVNERRQELGLKPPKRPKTNWQKAIGNQFDGHDFRYKPGGQAD